VRDMKNKKTVYLTKQADEKLRIISKDEYRSMSNLIENLIINYKKRI